MVPIQTFLALLLGLAMVSGLTGCTQKLPPHPGNDTLNTAAVTPTPAPTNHRDTNPNPIVKPGSPDSKDILSIMTTEQSLELTGTEASKLYKLLAIAAEAAPGTDASLKIKQGSQFSCTQNDKNAYCDFRITFPSGLIKEVIAENAVKGAASEIAQEKDVGQSLAVSDPSDGPKASIFVKGDQAKAIFDALVGNGKEFNLDANNDYAPGIHRAGESVNCTKTALASAPTNFSYGCFIHVNLTKGSVDKVDPNNLY